MLGLHVVSLDPESQESRRRGLLLRASRRPAESVSGERSIRLRWWETILFVPFALLTALFAVGGQPAAAVVLGALLAVGVASRATVRERNIAASDYTKWPEVTGAPPVAVDARRAVRVADAGRRAPASFVSRACTKPASATRART